MAYRPNLNEQQQRERRQRGYQSSPSMAERFPDLREASLNLRFAGMSGLLPMPYRQIYTADMRAYFEVSCPSKTCGGSFDLLTAIGGPIRDGRDIERGQIACNGQDATGAGCPVRLEYEIEVRTAKSG